MVKIIFCDLDGTLFMPGTTDVSDQDVEAIDRWIQNGNHFVIATARNHHFLNMVTPKLKKYDFDCIGWSGASLYINHKTEKLYPFSIEEFSEIYNSLYEYRDYLKVTNICNEYIYGKPHSYVSELFQDDPTPFLEVNIDQYISNDYPPIIHLCYVFPNSQIYNQFYKDYYQIFNDEQYQLKIQNEQCFDITHIEAAKEYGIKEYLKRVNMSDCEFAVIGDSLNDVGMFHITPWSFCMKHGFIGAQKEANYIVHTVSEVIEFLENNEKG